VQPWPADAPLPTAFRTVRVESPGVPAVVFRAPDAGMVVVSDGSIRDGSMREMVVCQRCVQSEMGIQRWVIQRSSSDESLSQWLFGPSMNDIFFDFLFPKVKIHESIEW
jgi:hypothetical protein